MDQSAIADASSLQTVMILLSKIMLNWSNHIFTTWLSYYTSMGCWAIHWISSVPVPMDLKAINIMKSEVRYTKSFYNICIKLAWLWFKSLSLISVNRWLHLLGTWYAPNLFPADSMLALLIYQFPYVNNINFASSFPGSQRKVLSLPAGWKITLQ